jgi:hypothetical protein
MKPREFFPNMPDEVFNIWLQPALEKYGWPFSYPITSVESTSWEEIFGSNIAFRLFSNCHWAFTELVIGHAAFHKESIDQIDLIFYNATAADTPVIHLSGNRQSSRQIFERYALFSKQSGQIAAPIIVTPVAGGQLKIVDGHHRLSAFLHTVQEATLIPCWHPAIKP